MVGEWLAKTMVTRPAALIAALDTDVQVRLAPLRKKRGLARQTVAERVGNHVCQLGRYEARAAQLTLDVLRRLAGAPSASANRLIADPDERDPDDDPLLHGEAIQHLRDNETQVAMTVIESAPRHQARRNAPHT